jgi:hypothetical protein
MAIALRFPVVGTAVNVTDGSFDAAFANQAVTTLVCK